MFARHSPGAAREGPGEGHGHRYTGELAGEIEARWRAYWDEHKTFHVERDDARRKFYVLDMFAGPSGALHVGHPLGYVATDVYGRYLRMRGFNVMHAFGYDAFGLPAEQYAVQTGQHPRVTTEQTIATIRGQLHRLGLAHDPRRGVATTDVAYYRWTQWIFLQIYHAWYDDQQDEARPIAELEAEYAQNKRRTPDGRGWCELTRAEQRKVIDAHRLVYLDEVPVNWCPGLGTVLANEEVTADGRSRRGNFPVFPRRMRQWMMRITAYADRLIADLDLLDWPESIKLQQRNWIGRSEGAYIRFPVADGDRSIEVFTTRPETLSGATFLAVGPEHPAAADLVGVTAVNPLNGRRVPVVAADYVLEDYGSGIVMGVPDADERDRAFAFERDLSVVAVDPGVRAADVVAWLEEHGYGKAGLTYRLRDWLFSRQRYWGEPFPIVYDDDGPVALPERMLPVDLPETPDHSPRTYDPDDAESDPEAPLARLPDWVSVTLDLGDGPRAYRRETNTMPQWAGSCWYEMRYLDPANDERFCDPDLERYWMGPRGASAGAGGDGGGVDLYVGGVEHAVLHLLYARFWHKVLYDLGHVSSREPYRRLLNQGNIQAYIYSDARGFPVPAAEVEERDGGFFWRDQPVTRSLGKMGKSLQNAVTPDEMCERYGADTFRVYEMSMGPLAVSRPWEPKAVVGSQRFLQRVWRALVDETTGSAAVVDEPASEETRRVLHKTIDVVGRDMDGLAFNTAVARLIELTNHVTGLAAVPREAAEPLVLMLAPLAPHLAEELWARLGHVGSLAYAGYPVADPAHLVEETVTCVVQVAGRLRDRLEVSPGIGDGELRELALSSPKVRQALDGRSAVRVVVRAPKLVNVVPARVDPAAVRT